MHRLARGVCARPPAAASFGAPRRQLPIQGLGGKRFATPYSSSTNESSPTSTVPDALADGDLRGRTGGGPALEGSAPGAAPKPKISNMSVPGGAAEKLTEEQKREVEEHNRDFDQKHDRAAPASGDKVDNKYWKGGPETQQK